MKTSPASLGFAPNGHFKYVGGDAALDLINTADWTARGLAEDLLPDYAAVVRWAEGAGVVSAEQARVLRRAAAARERQAAVVYDAVRDARWVLQRFFVALVTGEEDAPALADFNELLTKALEHLCVSPGDDGAYQWAWRLPPDALDTPLWLVVWSAARLSTSSEAPRIRRCAGPDCGWFYVDRSRNGLRRWCDMATCGTRAKSRRRAQRNRGDRRSRGARR